jgi:molecular chaperone GrpE
MPEKKQPASAEASAGEEKKELNLEELKKKLDECQKLKDEYLAGWQRERADFLNYKKEEMGRIGELLKYAGTELILKLLPILDNFELAARQNFPSENLSGQEKEKINRVIEGFLQIKKQVLDFLKSLGIEPIDCLGKKFDPNFHEVVEEVAPAEDSAGKSGIIIEEIQKGYKFQSKVLRPAKVKISK